MYEIRHAASKGLGVFATKAIPRGTRILAERPRFTVRSDHDLLPVFKTLPPEDKQYLKSLSVSGATKPWLLDASESAWHVLRGALSSPAGLFSVAEYRTLLAAFRNNSFDIGDGVRAIFNDISRINHSCVPNAQGNFNTTIGAFAVHAIKDVEASEEVTVSYLDEHGAMRAVRQAQLWQGYGFDCGCPVCDGSGNRGRESERRRRSVREQLTKFAETAGAEGREPDVKGEVEMLKVLVRMFELEGLAGRELATMYLSVAEGSEKVGDRVAALEYAKKGLEMEGVCLGDDSQLYKESVLRMRKIPGAVVKR